MHIIQDMWWYMQDGPPKTSEIPTPLRVAVIENTAIIRDTLKIFLNHEPGYQLAAELPTEHEANQYVAGLTTANAPDLIILDWSLRSDEPNVWLDRSGWNVLSKIREWERTHQRQIPVIILTAEPKHVEDENGALIAELNNITYGKRVPTPIVGKEDPATLQMYLQEARTFLAEKRR